MSLATFLTVVGLGEVNNMSVLQGMLNINTIKTVTNSFVSRFIFFTFLGYII